MIKDHMVRNYKRFKTNYPGVVYRETDRQGKVYYIRYKRPGERRVIEDKLTGMGWTPAKPTQSVQREWKELIEVTLKQGRLKKDSRILN